MANTTIQLRRSSVAGKLPNTSTLSIGELGLNLTDQKLYSSNGSVIFEPAANVTTLYVGNSSVYTTVNSTAFSGTANNASYLGGVAAASYVNTSASYTITGVHTHSANLIISSGSGISANGSFGTAGQVLTTNSSAVYWSTSSGGTGTIPVRQQYTGDGSNTVYTVTGGYVANSISVYLNGVMLRNGTEVTVTSGSTFTMATAPANGALIDVVGVSPLNSNGVNTVVNQQFTSNGTSNSFTITNGYISNSVAVFLNGVKQIPGTDVVITSGNTVNFAVTPANNYLVDVFGFSNPVALSSNVISVGNVSIGTGTIIVGNATVNSTLSTSSLYVQSVSTQPTINLNSSSSSVGNRPLMVFQTTNTALTQFFGGLLWSSTLVGGATTQSAQIIGLGSSSNSSGYIDLVAQTTGNGNFVVQTAGSGANSITSNSTGTYLLSNTLSVGTAVYHVANGNMGIGITNPPQTFALGNSTDQFGAAVSGSVTTVYFGTPSNGSGGIKNIAYDRGTGNLNFIGGTVASPSTQMTLDNSGNVGIGTSSPATKLQVSSSTGSSSDDYGFIQANYTGTTTTVNAGITVKNYQGTSQFMQWDVIGLRIGSRIKTNTGTGQVVFTYGNDSEGMRIDSSGNLLVGTTSTINGAKLTVVGGTTGIVVRHSSATAGKYWNSPYIDTNNTCYIINQNNAGVYLTDGSTAWVANSDERLKDIISPITSALEGVKSLRAVRYSWKNDEIKVPHIGLIAQDVQSILPEVVHSSRLPQSADETEYLSVAYTEVIPLLVAAIKELSAKNDALEIRLAALEIK